MTTLRLYLPALFLALALTAVAPLTPANAGSEELTDERIERYLDAMRDLRAFADELDERRATSVDEDQAQALREEHAAILDSHGFSEEQWMALHERIFEAAVAIAVQREMTDEDIERAFRDQRERVRNDPDIADEQRDLMLEQIDDQLAAFRDMEDNPDRDAVEPYMDEFEALFGNATP